MDDVAARFESHRPRLHAIAFRTLGSVWTADDAVQEAWIRLQRTDVNQIENLEAWLTTVVSRICVDMIRHSATRREELEEQNDEAVPSGLANVEHGPAEDALLSDDLALAMDVVLETLGPLERLALVLHDVFALSFDDIAPIVERSPAAARQLASRARARLRTVDVNAVRERRAAAIEAFLSAAREGDFGGLLQLLDPEIELNSDSAALELAAAGAEYGAPLLDRTIRGGDAVAKVFAGRAELTRLISLGGVPAAAYVDDGTAHALYLITFDGDRIARLDVVADAALLAGLPVAF
ncbi:sigma-70 family RNA polymerase sigma factor [Gordonia araii NBRC 100433]|nr:sigma-70 family RNA polymerase sigma factor [Gordonia araii]NNG97953.1 sigma-70 family RNA polymerase sigma factor [Gordonia araii NBRC 100433]